MDKSSTVIKRDINQHGIMNIGNEQLPKNDNSHRTRSLNSVHTLCKIIIATSLSFRNPRIHKLIFVYNNCLLLFGPNKNVTSILNYSWLLQNPTPNHAPMLSCIFLVFFLYISYRFLQVTIKCTPNAFLCISLPKTGVSGRVGSVGMVFDGCDLQRENYLASN